MPHNSSVNPLVSDVSLCIDKTDGEKNESKLTFKEFAHDHERTENNEKGHTGSEDLCGKDSFSKASLSILSLNDLGVPDGFDNFTVTENDLECMLRAYLGDNRGDSPWTVKSSPISGRGVFATRDLKPGDLVFRDIPLVVGPRAGSACQSVCAGCHKTGATTLRECSRGCGLPVCSAVCESAARHRAECRLLSRPERTAWSPDLLRALTPLRCLLMPPENKNLLLCLQAHQFPQHAFEVEFIKNEVSLSPREEQFLVRVCCALDSNAFRVSTSLKGLYPLGSLLNHQCTPNTRHVYDADNVLVVRTTVCVPAGTELTNSYTPLLWSTQARRHNLAFTKHFACNCLRCQDPQEMGTRLACLPCARDGCPGALLSTNQLQASSRWRCDVCGISIPGRQAAIIQNTLGGLLGSIDHKDPQQVANFLLKQQKILPKTNQIVVELKCTLVELYGHCAGYTWPELSDDMLKFKESICRELLELVQLLGAGQCKLRGVFLYELHCTLVEKLRRQSSASGGLSCETQDTLHEAVVAIQEAASIFQDDHEAPNDVQQRLNTILKQNCTNIPESL